MPANTPRPPKELENRIAQAMLADRFRLRRKLEGLAGSGEIAGRPLTRWVEQLETSIALRQQRQSQLPGVEYDDALPICQRRDEIMAAIAENQVVVVCGETGSGKSTQLPKMCLELDRGVAGMIAHTQPRRIAARSIAHRIAEELKVPLGQQVGFKIRFTDVTSPQTYVKLMTDGMLLAELGQDRFLEQYDTIIIDEAHERSLNIDFLLGYMKRLLAKRPELKLIITSATIDAARFARHFSSSQGPAPVVEVSGRAYPVEVRYRPLTPDEDDDTDAREVDWVEGVLGAVDELARIDHGDMLIFCPTERDIHELSKALREQRLAGDDAPSSRGRRTEILPLYARLPAKEQQRVFQSHSQRRIVIATNVAESSLTVPGIRSVIDLGTARISRYSARSKTQRLPIDPISQASADQRKGRCGRIGPGICVRLYSEEDYLGRDRYTVPEIQRSNLASVILQMKSLRLGDVERFPFLDPPRRETVRDGYKTLFELGAIDEHQRLTVVGGRLSRLPVDPRIGRMILAASEEDCLSEMLIIAAALEVQDPRVRPVDHEQAADEAHAAWRHENSDFLTYLNLWDFYHGLKSKLSRNQLRKACQQNYLSYNRMREWVDVHQQLLQLAREADLKARPRRDDHAAVHRAVLTGLFTHVGWRRDSFEYTTAGGSKANIWPGSTVFKSKPRWLVAAEMVETTRRYLRTCARIQPEWIEDLAPHLVKRTYSQPEWDSRSASAMADERVTLFGLPIVPRRRIHLGPVDPATAREMLIEHGLVEAQWEQPPAFLQYNQEVLAEIEQMEGKLRRRDLMPGAGTLYRFYNDRLPDDVFDGPRLVKWLRHAEKKTPGLLRMSVDELLRDDEAQADAALYPQAAIVGATEVPLEYRYEPGSTDDGITITVPLPALPQVNAAQLNWLVPGMLEQKITALIKSLPKEVRRKLVPAPDTARRVAPELRFGQGDLLSDLAAALGRIAGEHIAPRMFDTTRLPEELQMNLRVVDAEGETLAAGRDVDRLRNELSAEAAEKIEQADDPRFRRDDITRWDFDELPERVRVNTGGVTLEAYPALVDRGESVSLRLAESLPRAETQTSAGLRRLFVCAAGREIRSQLAWLPNMDKLVLWAGAIPGFKLKPQLADLIAARAYDDQRPLARTAEQFDQQVKAARQRIGLGVQDVLEFVPAVLERHHRARLALEQIGNIPRFAYATDDIREQLDRLVGPTFLGSTPWEWLKHFPRYFEAIEYRIDKLRGGGQARDARSHEEFQAWWQRYVELTPDDELANPTDPELARLRWMLEEYRVSLFAQPLGTAEPISAKRIEKQVEKAES